MPSGHLAVGNFDAQHRAVVAGRHQDNVAAMRSRQIARYGKAEAGAATACRSGKWLKQLGMHARRDSRTIVADFDLDALTVTQGGHPNAPFGTALNQSFDRVTDQVE